MTGDLLSPALISKRRRAIDELVLSPEMEIHRQLWAAARAWSDPRRLRPWGSHAVCPYKSPGVPQRRNCDRRRCRRSEEHTSELQSLRHLVCRLLLEKKNIQK